MNPIRTFFSFAGTTCLVLGVTGLLLALASTPLPNELWAIWRHVPGFGYGYLGRIITLLLGSLAFHALATYIDPVERPLWVEYHRW